MRCSIYRSTTTTCSSSYQPPPGIIALSHSSLVQLERAPAEIIVSSEQWLLITRQRTPHFLSSCLAGSLSFRRQHGGNDAEIVLCGSDSLPLYLPNSRLFAHHHSYFPPRDNTQGQQDTVQSPRRGHRREGAHAVGEKVERQEAAGLGQVWHHSWRMSGFATPSHSYANLLL